MSASPGPSSEPPAGKSGPWSALAAAPDRAGNRTPGGNPWLPPLAEAVDTPAEPPAAPLTAAAEDQADPPLWPRLADPGRGRRPDGHRWVPLAIAAVLLLWLGATLVDRLEPRPRLENVHARDGAVLAVRWHVADAHAALLSPTSPRDALRRALARLEALPVPPGDVRADLQAMLDAAGSGIAIDAVRAAAPPHPQSSAAASPRK